MSLSTETASDRYLVISTDAHDSPPFHLEKYRDHLATEYLDEFDAWLEASADHLRVGIPMGGGYSSDHPDPYRRWAMNHFVGSLGIEEPWATEALERYWPEEPPGLIDPMDRLRAVETQGIVAEVLVTFGIQAGEVGSAFGAGDPRKERAAAEAHMRWLAAYCGATNGRIASPIRVDGSDLTSAVSDMQWARQLQLFGGVYLPTASLSMSMQGGTAGGPALPPYVDPYWEPLWSACEDLDLPLVVHIGQLFAPDMMTGGYGTDMVTINALSVFELAYFARRPFWHLIAAGVFDRHPKLKFCFIECPVGAIPGMFYEMDHMVSSYAMAHGTPRHFKMLPSEYWHAHGFAAASLMSKHEAALRHEIGINNLMFGSDYPHFEGSWPYTLKVQQHMFGGIPQADLRAILGENAARCFGFDLGALRTIADRVGPTVEQLASPLPEDDIPEFAPSFSFRR